MLLQGVLPPMVTPLDAEERLDEAGLERQLDRLLAALKPAEREHFRAAMAKVIAAAADAAAQEAG